MAARAADRGGATAGGRGRRRLRSRPPPLSRALTRGHAVNVYVPGRCSSHPPVPMPGLAVSFLVLGGYTTPLSERAFHFPPRPASTVALVPHLPRHIPPSPHSLLPRLLRAPPPPPGPAVVRGGVPALGRPCIAPPHRCAARRSLLTGGKVVARGTQGLDSRRRTALPSSSVRP